MMVVLEVFNFSPCLTRLRRAGILPLIVILGISVGISAEAEQPLIDPSATVPHIHLILAHLYFDGVGGPKDLNEAKKTLKVLALSLPLDDVRRNRRYAKLEEWDAKFIELIDNAIAWQERIDREGPQYAYDLSHQYRADEPSASSKILADLLLSVAAEAKLPQAQFEVVKRFFDAPEPRLGEAALLMLLFLAKEDHSGAQEELARQYLAGNRLQRDSSKAYYWLLRAKANGAPIGEAIEEMAKDLTEDERKRASSWMAKGPVPEP